MCFVSLQLSSFKTSRCSQVPWTLLGISKVLLTVALAVLPLIDLVWLLWYREEDHEVSPATFVADAVRLATYLTALVIQILCQVRKEDILLNISIHTIIFQKHGLVTSGPLFIYWFVAAVCFTPTFRFTI